MTTASPTSNLPPRKSRPSAKSKMANGKRCSHSIEFRDLQPFGQKPNALESFNPLRTWKLAPRGRFELPTFRLTAECSTIELPGNISSLNYSRCFCNHRADTVMRRHWAVGSDRRRADLGGKLL